MAQLLRALALVLGVAAMGLLGFYVNVLTAILTLVALIGYAVVYTRFLKHATPQNIVIGGAAPSPDTVTSSCDARVRARPIARSP